MRRDILSCKIERVALGFVQDGELRGAETGNAGMMSKLGAEETPSQNQRDAGDMKVVKRT